MSFTVPTFNLEANLYTGWNLVSDWGPLRATVKCNLAWGRRFQNYAQNGNFEAGVPTMSLLLPAGTDIRDGSQVGGLADGVECPAGSGRWYGVVGVDDVGRGFLNEFRVALLIKSPGPHLEPWPVPIP